MYQLIFKITIFSFLLTFCTTREETNYTELIAAGKFSEATGSIKKQLADNKHLTGQEKTQMNFQIERMARIKKDFTATEKDVKSFIKKYIPDVDETMMHNWEEQKALEYKLIDGQKRYFKYAGRNLFRINKQAKAIWQAHHKDESIASAAENALNLVEHNRAVMKSVLESDENFVEPVTMKITYSITVPANTIPNGELLKCWIPFPREIPGRQTDIEIISTSPQFYQLADPEQLQRTVFFTKEAKENRNTTFSVSYKYKSYGFYQPIMADSVQPLDDEASLKEFLEERPPHIVFTPALKKLSQEIVGDEHNPYRKAKKIFSWIDEHIPWASAREYSTISNISSYSYKNMHGDCGIQTLLFITLLRMNGIPARWQSGWEFQPPKDSMHDWGMVYFAPYGWVPMDVTYGRQESEEENEKFFYLNGMDSYRLIFNDDYAQPFQPPKDYFRSETLDSQRGEVEWAGGNLYFDQWDWDIDWAVINSF